MIKTILITGASTGIGYGAAKAFIQSGYRVIATVRSERDQLRLAQELGTNLFPVICDVTHTEQVQKLPLLVQEIIGHEPLDGLINNAGILLSPGPVEMQNITDIHAQFDVNVFGLITVTQVLLPLLGTKGGKEVGRIINISSVGGKIASPFIAAYAASKHAVEGFSDALRRELRLFGIKVIIVGPGAIKTEIWNKNRIAPEKRFVGTAYEQAFAKFAKVSETIEDSGASPEEIGTFLVKIFETKSPRARYAYMHGRFLNWTLPVMLPAMWLDALLGAMMGLKKK